jgi:hypothetical protein
MMQTPDADQMSELIAGIYLRYLIQIDRKKEDR